MKLPFINVFGCGWFGFALAKFLVSNGYSVKGSTTTEAKLALLADNEIDAYLLKLEPKPIGDYHKFFSQSEILIIAIPPGPDTENYAAKISGLINFINRYRIKQVIFISSTSVYRNANTEADDYTVPQPETDSGRALLEAENMLLEDGSFTLTVLRFAGLVGPGRHPGRFFAGKKNIPNGKSPVNLLHLDDCIQVVYEIIKQHKFGGIYNVCSPDHPEKQQFYYEAATVRNLEAPQFTDELNSWKKINGSRIARLLDISYQTHDLLSWLKTSAD
ncbi:SDR family NAD(P)-dependent oxidoreductase [Pedobacter sp. HMF7647]|uniref:SDR family NAD(P)-dependent oxidoreductase n=1 Tax=Hufsiella arboris TaxID=2695275 RepID=A0A7K1Y4V3_9SPHI|nr:SDR family oxidoreductase [Hufsiella arboris]MXV49602.1 SDR family NAD(P)-dependent oxidoreductase [Hufsiella arboris]